MVTQVTPQQFDAAKLAAEDSYKTIGSVYCPYFQESISFGAAGLEHIKFKRHTKPRSEKDQYMRLKLLHLAPQIVKGSHMLQGKLETKRFERIRINGRTESVLVPVTYYEFIALIKRDRVKVIVKQIGTGQKIFWSIIPFWGMDNITRTRLFHSGLPEED